MPKIQVFVVSAQNIDYDDNYYYTTDGGSPVKVYSTKEKADAESARLQSVMEAAENIQEYQEGYDADGNLAPEWPQFFYVTQLEIEKSDIIAAPPAPIKPMKTNKRFQPAAIAQGRAALGGIIRPKE